MCGCPKAPRSAEFWPGILHYSQLVTAAANAFDLQAAEALQKAWEILGIERNRAVRPSKIPVAQIAIVTSPTGVCPLRLQEVQELKLPVDEYFYNSLLSASARAGDLTTCRHGVLG